MNLILIGIEYIYLKTYTILGPVTKNATWRPVSWKLTSTLTDLAIQKPIY